MARVSNYKLPADIQKLQYEANQRLAKLEQSYAKNPERKSRRLAIEYLQKRAGTYNQPEKRFTFEPVKGTSKTLDQQLTAYQKKLESALSTKTTVKDLQAADKKRKASISDYIGHDLTWEQYDKLMKAVDNYGDSVLYNISKTMEAVNEGNIQLSEGMHEKGRRKKDEIVEELISQLGSGVKAIDLVNKSEVLEYNY